MSIIGPPSPPSPPLPPFGNSPGGGYPLQDEIQNLRNLNTQLVQQHLGDFGDQIDTLEKTLQNPNITSAQIDQSEIDIYSLKMAIQSSMNQ